MKKQKPPKKNKVKVSALRTRLKKEMAEKIKRKGTDG